MRYNDTVMVGNTPVTLDNHFYHLTHLEGGEPDEAVLRFHERALGEMIDNFMEQGGVFAFRHPNLIQVRGVEHCRVMVVNGIACRHLVDWDHEKLQARSLIDVFAGRTPKRSHD